MVFPKCITSLQWLSTQSSNIFTQNDIHSNIFIMVFPNIFAQNSTNLQHLYTKLKVILTIHHIGHNGYPHNGLSLHLWTPVYTYTYTLHLLNSTTASYYSRIPRCNTFSLNTYFWHSTISIKENKYSHWLSFHSIP